MKTSLPSHRPRPPIHGFTLIEVLVAAALFAIAATTLVGVVVNTLTAIQAQEHLSTREADQAFVFEQLKQIEDLDTLESGGRIPLPEDRSVEWEAEHEPTEIADLHRIEFTLTWDTEDETEPTVLSVYRLVPWLSEPVDRETLLSDKRRELEAAR